jgi:prepilin-type N-terminal cleavage/methylation domain-containing protein
VRRALTLVELLVVIAIIALMVGILLPAVQKVREAANRLKCTANLHEISLGLHGYHDVYESFPTAGSWSSSRDGWFTQIHPWLDRNPAMYCCPSRRPPTLAGTKLVRNDYAGVVPDADFWQGSHFGLPSPGASYGGVLVRNSAAPGRVSFASLSRGSSNVMVASEKRLRPSQYYSLGISWDDMGWQDGFDFDVMRQSDQRHPPRRDGENEDGYGMGAAHPAGMLAVFADGSVRGVSYSTDLGVWTAMGRRDE